MTAPAATIPADPADPAETPPPRLLKDVSREPYGRRALVAAAAEVFSERGYDDASIHDKIKARFYLPLRDGFAKLVRMAFPEHPDRQDQIRMALWSSALGALSFSHTAVRPGDTLVTVAQNLRLRNPLAVFAVRGYVGDTLVAEATIKCMIGQR